MKKRIVLFHQEFYFSGGAEKLIFEEMDFLLGEGHQVSCWAPLVARSHCFPERIGKYKIFGFFPYISFFPREILILLSLLSAPIFAWRFRNVDLFYGENQGGPYFAFVMAKIWKKPYIVFMPYPVGLLYPRRIDEESGLLIEVNPFIRFILLLFRALIRSIDRMVLLHADSVLTTGGYAKSLFENIYKREILDAPSGAEVLSQSEIESTNRWQGQVWVNGMRIPKPYILLTNRPMPKKKFEYIVECISRIRERVPKVHVVIAGEFNDYLESMLILARNLQVEKFISCLGFLDGEEIAKVYRHAAVYAYTAPEEDYGKGMVEAMANALPVVAWDSAGPTGIVRNGKSGYLAKPFDIDDFAHKLSLLLENRERNEKMGWYGWRLVKAQFSPKHHNEVLRFAVQKSLG